MNPGYCYGSPTGFYSNAGEPATGDSTDYVCGNLPYYEVLVDLPEVPPGRHPFWVTTLLAPTVSPRQYPRHGRHKPQPLPLGNPQRNLFCRSGLRSASGRQ